MQRTGSRDPRVRRGALDASRARDVLARARGAGLLLVALLTGCASPGPAPGDLPAAPVDRFTVEGKIAWRHPDDRGRASVEWVQGEDRARLVVTGPFGAGAAVLETDARGASIVVGDERRTATDPEELLDAVLGLPLPVRAARWWVLGLPAPGAARLLERDEIGRPSSFTQNGWSVRVVERVAVDGLALPRRLDLVRDDVEVRFVATRWQPGRADFVGEDSVENSVERPVESAEEGPGEGPDDAADVPSGAEPADG